MSLFRTAQFGLYYVQISNAETQSFVFDLISYVFHTEKVKKYIEISRKHSSNEIIFSLRTFLFQFDKICCFFSQKG